jgi:MFS transporter, DHA1 family, tetracycline resistance protein
MKKSSLLVLFLTVFIDLIGFGMVIPFLPFYAREYGATGRVVGAVVGIYSIMQFFFAPVWGRLSDRIGRRPVLLFSLTTTFAGYVLFAFAHSLTALFVSRIIAGIGGANIGTAQAYITDSTEPDQRARGMGLIGAAFGMGFILGPPLSGVLSHIGMSHGFHGNLLPGLAAAGLSFSALAIGFFALKESRPPDLVPRSGRPPQFDPKVWRQIAHHPVLPWVMASLFLTALAVAGMETSVTLHARDRFHFRQMDMAYFFLFMGVIVAGIQGGLLGRLAKRFGEQTLIVAGSLAFTLGFMLIPSIYRTPLLYGVAALIAIGQGLCQPSLITIVSKVAPESERGSLLGLATSAGSLARFFGPIVAGFLYDWAHADGAFYGGGLIMAAALMIAIALRRMPIPHGDGSQPAQVPVD